MGTVEIRCSGCGTRNRVPLATTGRARCGRCQRDLPWLVDVGAAELDAVVDASPVPVLVDLWAEWCGPCKMIAPELAALAGERAGSLRILKVDVDEHPEVSARLGVQGIPTMVLYSGGRIIDRQVGAAPGHAIRTWVDGAVAGSG